MGNNETTPKTGMVCEHCQSPTKWPPAGHWCECLRPNNQKQTSWGWPERARCPLVGPVLTARHRGAWLPFAIEHQNWQVHHWRPVLLTDESRFTLSTCDRRERVWRSRGERYAACNIVQHDRFGGGSVMVWGGLSMEGCTDLYSLDQGSPSSVLEGRCPCRV